jgi:hypothetical protein
MNVAMMTRMEPAAMPARRPAKSASGPPKHHPAMMAPTVYEVLMAPYKFAFLGSSTLRGALEGYEKGGGGRTMSSNQLFQFLEPDMALNVEAS